MSSGQDEANDHIRTSGGMASDRQLLAWLLRKQGSGTLIVDWEVNLEARQLELTESRDDKDRRRLAVMDRSGGS